MALTTKITDSTVASLTSDNAAISGKLTVSMASQTISLANGNGADQANRVYRSTRSLTASSDESIDLFDFGGATDGIGQTYSLSKVKSLTIRKTSKDDPTAALVIGAASTNPWLGFFGDTSDTIKIYTGVSNNGDFKISNPSGWTVTEASSRKLKIANADSSNAVTYEIIVVGSQ